MKSVRIWNFSGPYFPAFGLNTDRYEVSLRIQSKCGNIRTRKNSVFGYFSRSDCIKMEFQKIINLLDATSDDKDLPRFVTKKWIKGYDQSEKKLQY